jgi:RNase adapter protein RapZ
MADHRRFVLVTGLSGSGKGQAMRILEDLGYYCVDNLPATLIPKLAELVLSPGGSGKRIAVCVDARTGDDLLNLPAYLQAVAELGVRPDAVFLDSATEILMRRYSETRRRHPSAPDGNVEEGVRRERELLAPIRAQADLVIDTSATSVAELRERIASMFQGPKDARGITFTLVSFGFKYGLPPEADLVLDVRFLPNPYYEKDLRQLSGLDDEVRDYVLNNDTAREFLARLRGMLKFLVPQYIAEPKSYLTIAVGCTGGRHRSVAVAAEMALFLRSLQHDTRIRHRDIERPL